VISTKELEMNEKNFDVIVIGTGTAGLTAANKCNAEGKSVAIIDHKPFGGTCALRGCDPKKILVGFAEAVDQVNRLQENGVIGEVKINWQQMIKFKNEFTSPIPAKREDSLTANGISTFHGPASFSDTHTIKIGNETIKGKNIIIATGAGPMKLPFEGNDLLIDNEQFLNLPSLPRKILFVGGGYISMEFAHIAAISGAEVIVINDKKQVLDNFDHFLVGLIEERTKTLGITLINEATVEGVIKENGGYKVKYRDKENLKEYFVDLVVHGAGRTPNVMDLNLEAANVLHDKRGIIVNSYMQSISNPSVYAAGDVAKGGLPLTPVASFEAHIVASNIVNGNSKEISYPPIPSVAFTIPHLASVGLTEEEANKREIRYKVNYSRTSDWFSSRRLNEKYEGHKILLSEDGKFILGAHLLGHRADEVINLFTIAIHKKMATPEIKKMILAYPTSSSDISYML
jgi:glutathione reductase (NADPH)